MSYISMRGFGESTPDLMGALKDACQQSGGVRDSTGGADGKSFCPGGTLPGSSVPGGDTPPSTSPVPAAEVGPTLTGQLLSTTKEYDGVKYQMFIDPPAAMSFLMFYEVKAAADGLLIEGSTWVPDLTGIPGAPVLIAEPGSGAKSFAAWVTEQTGGIGVVGPEGVFFAVQTIQQLKDLIAVRGYGNVTLIAEPALGWDGKGAKGQVADPPGFNDEGSGTNYLVLGVAIAAAVGVGYMISKIK